MCVFVLEEKNAPCANAAAAPEKDESVARVAEPAGYARCVAGMRSLAAMSPIPLAMASRARRLHLECRLLPILPCITGTWIAPTTTTTTLQRKGDQGSHVVVIVSYTQCSVYDEIYYPLLRRLAVLRRRPLLAFLVFLAEVFFFLAPPSTGLLPRLAASIALIMLLLYCLNTCLEISG